MVKTVLLHTKTNKSMEISNSPTCYLTCVIYHKNLLITSIELLMIKVAPNKNITTTRTIFTSIITDNMILKNIFFLSINIP